MKKKTFSIIIALTTLIAAGIIAYLLYHFYQVNFGDPDSIADDNHLSESDIKKINDLTETINVLCIGVDYSQELTDVLIYIQFDPKVKSVQALSIPRDSYVGDDYPTGKINNVYRSSNSDVNGLIDVLEERFHLPIDYYAMITIEAFSDIVDQIGGVEITLEQDLWDFGEKLFSAGTQTLNGQQAQRFVRLRHAYVDADLGRINAQHDFLIAAMHKVQSLGKLQTLQLVMNNFNKLKSNIPLGKAFSIASTAFSLTEDDIEMYTVPGLGKWNNSYAVYEVDLEGLAALLNEHFLSRPITAEDLNLPQVTESQPESKPLEEEPLENEELGDDSSSEEEITEPIYPSIRDYDSLTDGDYEDWFKRNTIYPEGWRAKKRTESSSSSSEEQIEPSDNVTEESSGEGSEVKKPKMREPE